MLCNALIGFQLQATGSHGNIDNNPPPNSPITKIFELKQKIATKTKPI